jgi:hypothetical protein
VSGEATSKAWRYAAFAAPAAAVGWWLVLAIRQVADGGFYSDDFGIQWDWDSYGWWEAVETQTRVMGAKPILAFLLPTAYEVLGDDPSGHQALAVVLSLAAAAAFFLVLRALRFETKDALPIALLALLFPWVSSVRLWPTGSLNNFAVLLLFAGLLLALRTLPLKGARGLLFHLPATALYVAAVLTYDATAGVAAAVWLLYIPLAGLRAAWPRALMDLAAVGTAAIWTRENTHKHVADLVDQLAHIPDIAREGAHLIAASLLPTSVPADMPGVATIVVLSAAAVVLVTAALRNRTTEGSGPRSGRRWALVAAASLIALAACWAIYLPQAFYTPTFRGIEDRVNIVAVYPAAVLVWAVLRAAGTLLARDGYRIAAAGAAAILVGYAIHDTRQQQDWAQAAELQEPVLEAVERTSAPDGSLLLVFGFPGETAPGVPVLNQTWDLHPAAQVLTESSIHTHPVFEGARFKCGAGEFTIQDLPSPLYWELLIQQRGTPRTFPYGQVTFLDPESGREVTIRSQESCERNLAAFEPGPFRTD